MQWSNLRVGARLGTGFAGVLVLMVAMAVLAVVELRGLLHTFETVSAMQQRVSLTQAWSQRTRLNVNRVLAVAQSRNDPQVQGYFDPLIKATTEEISTMQKLLEAEVVQPEAQALLTKVGELRTQYIAVRKAFFEDLKAASVPVPPSGDAVAMGEAMPAAMPVTPGVPESLQSKLLPAAEAYMAAQEELVQWQQQFAQQMSDEAKADVGAAVLYLAVLAVAGLALGTMVAYSTARSITEPVREAMTFADAVAHGDLTRDMRTARTDEFGELLHSLAEMQASLRRVVGQIRASSDRIGTASTEVAQGNQDLSNRTEQTASSLEETASSMEQLTSTVRQSADSARQANQLASSAAEVAQRGGAVVGEVVRTMESINHSSQKISDIITVIDSIAFQTNILALNAAVEAARAGEQGRGFAVVAGEVRTLAQRSAQAAKEIKDLIVASVDNVQAGSRLVQDAGATMSEIVTSVQRVSDIIGEITVATAEQSDGIAQVNSAVGQLDQMTQQNAALVEQSAAAAESLRTEAATLSEAIAVFRGGGVMDAAPVARSVGRPARLAPSKPVAGGATRSLPAGKTAGAAASAPRVTVAPAKKPAPAAKVEPQRVAMAAPSKKEAAAEDEWESF